MRFSLTYSKISFRGGGVYANSSFIVAAYVLARGRWGLQMDGVEVDSGCNSRTGI